MATSRRSASLLTLAGATAALLLAGSIHPVPARSQPALAADGSAAPALPPDPDPEPGPADGADDVDDETAIDPGAAPADPAERLAWLGIQVDARLAAHPRLAGARVGIAAVDLATGDALVQRDADGRYNLASNTKVITSTAALAALGSGHRFTTSALAVPRAFDRATGVLDGDLYLRGRGDPTLTSASLRQLASDLATLGLRRVTGQLVLDASWFDDVVEPPHFDEQPKERAGFRAPVAALSVDGNAVTIVIEPDPTGSGVASVRLEPASPERIRLVRQEVVTVAVGATRIGVTTQQKRDHVELIISGQLNVTDGTYYTRRRVDDPVGVVGEVFRAALGEQGIRLGQRAIERRAAPPATVGLASHESDDLATIVRSMNKSSNNFIAETLYKQVGAAAKVAAAAPGETTCATWDDAEAAVAARLAVCGVADPAVRVENGSGLFESTAVSPSELVAVLRFGYRDFRVGPDLIASLPIAGVDGTLRRRLQGATVRGRVRAKTGTLASVTTLAGFAGTDGGHLVAFAVLVNGVTGGARADARLLQDEIAATLVTWAAAP